MTNTNRRPRFATAEMIGRCHTGGIGRRYAKRALAKARRVNERRAIAAGRTDTLPRNRRAFICGWTD